MPSRLRRSSEEAIIAYNRFIGYFNYFARGYHVPRMALRIALICIGFFLLLSGVSTSSGEADALVVPGIVSESVNSPVAPAVPVVAADGSYIASGEALPPNITLTGPPPIPRVKEEARPWWTWRPWTTKATRRFPPQADWDYYSHVGSLHFDKRNTFDKKARFIPVDMIEELLGSERTGLEPTLLLGDGYDELWKFRAFMLSGSNTSTEHQFDLSYMRNKTILLIGDSIDRQAVDYMCRSLFFGKLQTLSMHTGTKDMTPIEPLPPLFSNEEMNEPHLCTVPDGAAANTRIFQLTVYGVTTTDEDFHHKRRKMLSPREYYKKLRRLRSEFERLGIVPDLIISGTIFWDLATFNMRNAAVSAPAQDTLSLSDVHDFHEKAKGMLALLHTFWPQATLMFRKQHGVQNVDGDWFSHDLWPPVEPIKRKPFMANKIGQLNAVVDHLVKNGHKSGVEVYAFDLMAALQNYMRDCKRKSFAGGKSMLRIDIAVDEPFFLGDVGLAIYAQMVLYYMKIFLSK